MATNKELLERAVTLQRKLDEMETKYILYKGRTLDGEKVFSKAIAVAKGEATTNELLVDIGNSLDFLPRSYEYRKQLNQILQGKQN